jgi:hypothetical protein
VNFHDTVFYISLPVKLCFQMTYAQMPNGQKLRRPEPNVSNNQNAHSQIRSANEGLPPALC